MNRHAGPDSTGRCEHPIMAKPEVRRALTCAVPHEDTHKKVYFGGGHVIKTITPRICPNSTDKFWPYHENLEMAKMLLAEAGYPDGFDMTISYDKAISEMEETCTLIKSNFEKIRIRVQLQGLPSAVYSDTKFSRKQMAHCDNFRPDYAQRSGWGDRFPGSAGFQPAGGPCGLEARAPRRPTVPERRRSPASRAPNLSFVRNQDFQWPWIADTGYTAWVYLTHPDVNVMDAVQNDDPELNDLTEKMFVTDFGPERLKMDMRIQELVAETAPWIFLVNPGWREALKAEWNASSTSPTSWSIRGSSRNGRGPGAVNAIAALAFLNIPFFLRVTRGAVLQVRERPFIEAARCAGNSGWRR